MAECEHPSYRIKFDGGRFPHVCDTCNTIIGWGYEQR